MADSLDATTRVPQRRRGTDADVPLSPALTIICHPAIDRVGERVRLGDGATELSRLSPMFRAVHSFSSGKPLADSSVSRKPVRIVPTAEGDLTIVPSDSSAPVFVDGSKLDTERTIGATELSDGVTIELGDRVALLLHELPPARGESASLGLIGASPDIDDVRDKVLRFAEMSASVLIRGESGTGKELVAQALHSRGPRHDKPFVSVNIASIPASMAASELFGHVAGAFTGATGDARGLFRRAHGGVLLLDEIGEATLDVQVALLRAVETGQVRPLGADKEVDVDVRIVAATDADLEQAAEAGTFRIALLHRLAGCQINIPPLRARRDDIARLLAHFAKTEHQDFVKRAKFASKDGSAPPWIEASLMARLVRYDWPGNVRELVNLLRQLVVSSDDLPLSARVFDEWTKKEQSEAKKKVSPPTPPPASRRRKVADIDEVELARVLAENRWIIGATAKQLGISRNSLLTRIEQSPTVRRPKDLTAKDIAHSADQCAGDLNSMSEQLAVSVRGLKLRMRELGLDRTLLDRKG